MSREQSLEDRRREIVEIAARILVEEGAHGLSVRHLAREAGSSTQLVYTLFGGKPGLADALYAEGFRRLGDSMAAALQAAPPPGDPERLIAMGRAYRLFALDQPALFSVMFGRAIPGFTPAHRTRRNGRSASFGQVVKTARECLDAGTLVGASPEDIARTCWVTGHGIAALETANLIGAADPDGFVETALRIAVDAFRPPAKLGS